MQTLRSINSTDINFPKVHHVKKQRGEKGKANTKQKPKASVSRRKRGRRHAKKALTAVLTDAREQKNILIKHFIHEISSKEMEAVVSIQEEKKHENIINDIKLQELVDKTVDEIMAADKEYIELFEQTLQEMRSNDIDFEEHVRELLEIGATDEEYKTLTNNEIEYNTHFMGIPYVTFVGDYLDEAYRRITEENPNIDVNTYCYLIDRELDCVKKLFIKHRK
jgi:hypothetical protein